MVRLPALLILINQLNRKVIMKLAIAMNTISKNEMKINIRLQCWKRIYLQIEKAVCCESKYKVNCMDGYRCNKCHTQILNGGNENKIGKLKCGHNICKKCILAQIKIITDGSYDESYDLVQCPVCNTQLNLGEIYNLVRQNEILELNKAAMSNANYIILCSLCSTKKNFELCILLKCGHSFCEKCLKGHVKNAINKGEMPKCLNALFSNAMMLYPMKF